MMRTNASPEPSHSDEDFVRVVSLKRPNTVLSTTAASDQKGSAHSRWTERKRSERAGQSRAAPSNRRKFCNVLRFPILVYALLWILHVPSAITKPKKNRYRLTNKPKQATRLKEAPHLTLQRPPFAASQVNSTLFVHDPTIAVSRKLLKQVDKLAMQCSAQRKSCSKHVFRVVDCSQSPTYIYCIGSKRKKPTMVRSGQRYKRPSTANQRAPVLFDTEFYAGMPITRNKGTTLITRETPTDIMELLLRRRKEWGIKS